MSVFEQALAGGVLVAAVLSIVNSNWRALLWLSLGVLDYLLTSAYHDAGLPLHPFFTALVDGSVALTIYFTCKQFGGQRWELPVYSAFWLSVIVNFVELAGGFSDTTYRLLLEVCNWIVILAITWTGITGLAYDGGEIRDTGSDHRRGAFRRAVDATFAPSRVSPLWFLRFRHT